MADADLLVLGGGCAGLSLGLRWAERPASGRTIILESRGHYTNDRTWCFWRLQPHRFQHLVTHAWSRMTVTSQARGVSFDCARTPYEMIPADRFYSTAQAAIARSSHVTLRLDTTVLAPPRRVGNLWHVETTAGPIVAHQIVDTRPTPVEGTAGPPLWQSFIGDEVECDAPCFDPSTAELMHFDSMRTGDVLFRYVLPSSPHRALIETTVFGPRRLGAADLGAIQADTVKRLCGGAGARVIRTERGVLPMGVTPQPAPTQGYVRVGLTSGAARPSTGYAFQRIQSWADACVERIARGAPAIGHAPEPVLRREMDRLFLRVLRSHPERGPELFTRMFGDARADRVIRFLSDAGTIADCAALGRRLPIGLFLRELACSVARVPASAIPEPASLGPASLGPALLGQVSSRVSRGIDRRAA